MLNPTSLENDLKAAFEEYLPIALSAGIKMILPSISDDGDELADKFGKTVSDILSEPLASTLAAAIDSYVKNIGLQGMILTTGTPAAQQAIISPAPSPVVAGVIPNTLKVV